MSKSKNAILNDFKKIVGKESAFIMSEEENNPYYESDSFDTGCYVLNAILSKGDIFAGPYLGKRIGISGESSTGKSYFTTGMVKNFLTKYPNANAVIFESEGSTLKEMLETFDVDMDRVLAVGVDTLEDFKQHSLAILDNIKAKQAEAKKNKEEEPLFIFVLDSLGRLDTERDFAKTREGKFTADMGHRSQVVNSIFRKITRTLAVTRTTLLVVNNSYTTLEMFSKQKSSGGGGYFYSIDVGIILSKAQDKEGDTRVGNIMTATVEKSRFVKDGTKVKIIVSYQKGINKYSGILNLAEECGLIKKEGRSLVFAHNGEKVTGKEVAKNMSKYFTDELMQQIAEKVKEDMTFGTGPIEFDDELDEDSVTDE